MNWFMVFCVAVLIFLMGCVKESTKNCACAKENPRTRLMKNRADTVIRYRNRAAKKPGSTRVHHYKGRKIISTRGYLSGKEVRQVHREKSRQFRRGL